MLQHANAAVISIEDVRGNESIVEEMASSIRVLAVTEGANGARLYWNGDLRRFRPPSMVEVDPTGAGDIFAAAFFVRLSHHPRSVGSSPFCDQPGSLLRDALRAGWGSAARRSPGGYDGSDLRKSPKRL